MSMNLKCSILIQKYVSRNILPLAVGIIFLMLMFHIFASISSLKIKTGALGGWAE
jgi:hypothetical protein